ncbi:MAG: AAA family ATPase [Lewinellaceae bacterium]|nr:AAA family ATPase [Lewinellaceae bacterium]
MKCPHCKNENPSQAQFCTNCGSSLQGICNQCGAANPTTAKFCMACGATLHVQKTININVSQKTRKAERRQLTVMFTDIVGSTALSEHLDPEDYRQVMLDYQEVANIAIQKHGGHIAQYLGDGLLVYFGYPKGLEDAPVAGVRAGLEIIQDIQIANKEWIKRWETEIKIRIGLHTGIVVVDDHLALGETTNIAARLQSEAPINGLVISLQTMKMIEGWFEVISLGERTLKGIAQPVEIFQVLRSSSAKTRLDVTQKVLGRLSPLVGRESEYKLIQEKWQRTQDGNGNLIFISGEAGIGKSRLVRAASDELVEAHNLSKHVIRCSAYHQTSAFHPLTEFLEIEIFRIRSEDGLEDRYAKVKEVLNRIGIDDQSTISLLAEFLNLKSDLFLPLQLSPVARKQRLIESISHIVLRHLPNQVLVIEDLHWADASTLEWLDFLVDHLPDQKLFLLCTSRPGYTPNWVTRSEVTPITLQRLSRSETNQISSFYADGKGLPPEILNQIFLKTEGIPLFVEELTKLILESGTMQELETEYKMKGDKPKLAIPTSLQDSLLARLDRLEQVKEVIQSASVIGREFSVNLLSVVTETDPGKLVQSLEASVQAEIIYRQLNDHRVVYKFKHALIQDAAYESLLKKQRVQLHQKIAEILNDTSDTKITQPELIAYHYTQGERPLVAIPIWLQAGQMAAQKHANKEAISHLEQGMSLLKYVDNDEKRQDLELDFNLTLGGVSIGYYGYTHPKVGIYFSRAQQIAQNIDITPKLAFILYNLQTYYMLSEESKTTNDLIEYCLQVGTSIEQGYLFNLFGLHIKGTVNVFLGQFKLANKFLKNAIEIYLPAINIPLELSPGGKVDICVEVWWSVSLQISGFPDQAKSITKHHLEIAEKHKDSRTLYHIYAWAGWQLIEAREWESAEKILKKYLPKAMEFGDPFFMLAGESFYNISKAYQGDLDAFRHFVNVNLETARKMGAKSIESIFSSYVAEIYLLNGDFINGLKWVNSSICLVNQSGYHMHTAELYRIKGLMLYGLNPQDPEIEINLTMSLEMSKKQFAKTYELRAACDLARLWTEKGKINETKQLVSGIYDSFTEGFESIDLKSAQNLLNEIENLR